MKKSVDDEREEMIIRQLLQHGEQIEPAPRHFTEKFMQKMNVASSPASAKPILDIKGKIIAWIILGLLFVAGMSVGQEIGDSGIVSQVGNVVRRFVDFDFVMILTTVIFSMALLLAFNEFLKKRFVKR